MLRFKDLMRTNVGRAKGKKLLIASYCLVEDRPEIFEMFSEEDIFPLKVCMEAEEFNRVAYKILSFIKYSEVKEVIVVTVDGSPHCIQLHHIIDDIRRHFAEISSKHFVYSKGKLIEVSYEAVKISRYLSKIKKIMDKINE